MSEVLDFFREQVPAFRDAPEDEVVSFVGETMPEFLKDPEFKGQFEALTMSPSRRPVVPYPGSMPEGAVPGDRRGEGRKLFDVADPLAAKGYAESELGKRAAEPEHVATSDEEERNTQIRLLSQMREDAAGSIEDPIRRKAFMDENEAALNRLGVMLVHEGEVHLPHVTGQQLQGAGLPALPAKIVAGTEQAAADVAEALLSPWGIATMGAGALPAAAQRAIVAGFVGDMALHAPDQLQDVYRAVKKGDPEEMTRSLLNAGASAYFITKGAELANRGPEALVREATGRAAGKIAGRMLGASELDPAGLLEQQAREQGAKSQERGNLGGLPGARAVEAAPEANAKGGEEKQGAGSGEQGARAEGASGVQPTGKESVPSVEQVRAELEARGAEPKEVEEFIASRETQSELKGAPVEPVKTAEIGTAPELMQFKRMDDTSNGVNEADKLSGKWDDLKAGNLLLWEPKHPAQYGLKEGERYIVANGHHRLEFGKRNGVEELNAQVVREADGFSANDARALGAEINIADGKGTIYDQAKFIRNEAATHGADAALERARSIGARGRKAAAIAIEASDPLFDSFVNERISPEQAEVIARQAPRDEGLQRAGIELAARGKGGAELANVIEAIKLRRAGGGKATQQDLFGADDTALKEAEAMGRRAAAAQRELSGQIAAVQGAAKRPEQARKFGVNVDDPAGILREVERLKGERERWENWALHPDLVDVVRGSAERGARSREPVLRSGENQGDLLMRQKEDFALAGEKGIDQERLARKRADAERAAAEAKAKQEKEQGNFAGFRSYGDYREGPRSVFEMSDADLGRLFGEKNERGAAAGDVEGSRAPRGFEFRNYEQFQGWMDARYAEQDLEGMKMAFAAVDAKTKIRYIKENRNADAMKKGWIAHLATGAPLPEGRPPITRTTPRPGPDGIAREPKAAPKSEPPPETKWTPETPRPDVPPRPPPKDPMSQVMGGLDRVRPMEMPEIVRLARELMGNVPFLKKLPEALRGFFNAKTGGITLNRDLFQNPDQAAKTLAHEIGHLADYLPDKKMDRGNILGRLATLKRWMTETFPKGPSGEKPMTAKEREGLRQQAEKSVGPRPSDPADLRAWRDEVAARYKDLLTQEMDRRGLASASEIWKEAYDLSKFWRPFEENEVPRSFLEYRRRAAEVYADAISVLLNDPDLLKTRAPRFWEMFFNYIDKKPEVKKAFAELQDLLARGPEAVLGKRLEDQRATYQTGEEILKEKLREKEARRKPIDFWRRLKAELVDQGDVLTQKVEATRKAGSEVPQWRDPRNAWEENLFADNRNMLDVERVAREVVNPVEAAGMDTITLGQALELQRIIGGEQEGAALEGEEKPTAGTRVGIANPRGMEVKTARDTLAHLYQSLGPEKAAVLEAATKRFRQLFFERAGEAWRAGIFSDELWEKTIVPNRDSYVAFRSLDHIDTYVSPMARKALGTLKDVENPFLTTMYKLAALNNLIMVQRAKIATRDFFRAGFPESWREVETRWNGRSREPIAKVADGMKRLEVLENGRPVAYDVDPYVAAAFERLTPADVSVITKLLDWPFKKVVYPLIIKFNPAFQLFFNWWRDLKRTSRNLGALTGMSTWQVMRNYVKAWETARGFVNGKLDPLMEEMLRSYAVGTPIDSFNKLDRGDVFGELLKRYKLAGTEEQNGILKTLMWLPRKVEYVGSIFEALPKVASYRALVKEGVKGRTFEPGEAAAMVRNYVGTPNFRVKGLHANVANVIEPFLNIFAQGYRADLKLAVTPKTAGGWWMRWALRDGSKALLLGLAAAGVLGKGLKEIFDGISEYDKSNYTVIPIGYETGGDYGRKIVYVRLPRDETSRFLSAATYKMVRALTDKSARKFPSEVFSMGAGIVPTITPLLRIGSAWEDYLRGVNPIDPWRNAPVVPETEFKAGGWDALKPMMRYSLDQAGVVNFFGWDPHAETTTEVVVGATPLVKRLVKVSDYGYRENQVEAQSDQERLKAIARLDYSEQVRELLREYAFLERMKDRRTPEQDRRYVALSIWHRNYSRTDEMSNMLEDSGQKDEAKRVRKEFAKTSESFEREGKGSWGKVSPIWK